MSNKIYKKVGKRYKEIGIEFTGFPVDGIWLVADGTQNCILKIADIPKVSPFYPELAIYEEECSKYINNKIIKNKKYSISDLSKWAAEFYSEKISKKFKEEK